MKDVLNYNIHNILTFKIVRDKKTDFMKDLNLPFSFFEVNEIENPDIILNIGKFSPSNSNCYIIDHKYYIKDNYFYCKDSGGSAKWEFEIFDFENGDTIINFDGKIIGPEALFYPDLLPQDILLRPLIEYKLRKKGYLLIHAGGVSKNNKGYVLTGRGSSFKTSLSMDLIRKSKFEFLGDDRVILHGNKILCFPVHLKAIEYKINNLPNETFRDSSNKLNIKSYMKFFNFLKYLHKNVDYQNIKVPIVELSTLKKIFFILRTKRQDVKKLKISSEEGIRKITINNQADLIKGHTFMLFDFGQYFYKYVLAYSFVFPGNLILKHWDDMENCLIPILKEIKIYEMEIPEKYNLDVYKKIEILLEDQ